VILMTYQKCVSVVSLVKLFCQWNTGVDCCFSLFFVVVIIFVRFLLLHMLTSGEGGWGVGRGGILLLIIVHMQIVLCG